MSWALEAPALLVACLLLCTFAFLLLVKRAPVIEAARANTCRRCRRRRAVTVDGRCVACQEIETDIAMAVRNDR